MDRLANYAERILSEDALKQIYKCELDSHHPTVQHVAGTLQITLDRTAGLLNKMVAHRLLRVEESEFHLTPEGQDYALQIIRAHRLWEYYLAEETGFAETEWHDLAHHREHDMSPAEIEALSAKLGHPTHDPHGDPIPTAEGEMTPHGGQPLAAMAIDQWVRIVHLENEPETVYAQLVAEELYVGMEMRLTEISSQRLRFWAGGEDHVLAPVVAANISVTPLPKEQVAIAAAAIAGQRLTNLNLGQTGQVVNISPLCRGQERRRLMDLGILPGTAITAEMRSPSGDPTAYLIRGALIALRREQANLINITGPEEAML